MVVTLLVSHSSGWLNEEAERNIAANAAHERTLPQRPTEAEARGFEAQPGGPRYTLLLPVHA